MRRRKEEEELEGAHGGYGKGAAGSAHWEREAWGARGARGQMQPRRQSPCGCQPLTFPPSLSPPHRPPAEGAAGTRAVGSGSGRYTLAARGRKAAGLTTWCRPCAPEKFSTRTCANQAQPQCDQGSQALEATRSGDKQAKLLT